jgi:mono/diheme cytochrome c family protein
LANNGTIVWGVIGGLAALVVIGGASLYFNPKRASLGVALLLMVGCMGLIGEFERVREFVRKPFIIYGYMYANGVRVMDVPLLNRDGFLKRAAFVPENLKTISDSNKIEAGKYLYEMECRYCHTIDGVNSIKARIKGWSESAIYQRIGSLNSPVTPFMPPFVGTDEERRALAAFLASLSAPPTFAVKH